MKLLLLSFLCLLGLHCSAQTKDQHYSKIVIENDLSQDESTSIENAVKQLDGMVTVRMDNTTHVLLAIYHPGINTNDQKISQWLNDNGYTIACYYSDVYEAGKLVDLSINNCH